MNMLSTTVISLTMAVSAVAVQAAPAYATGQNNTEKCASESSSQIVIPVDTVVWGDNGKEYELATKPVANADYKVKVEAINQGSIHPNTDIVVRSGTDKVTVADVEREAFGHETAEGSLTVADGNVTAYVKLGEDGVFSGGMCVVLTEVVPPTPPPVTPPTPPTPPMPPTPTPVPPAPTVLPATGSAHIAGIGAAVSVVGYFGHLLAGKRRAA